MKQSVFRYISKILVVFVTSNAFSQEALKVACNLPLTGDLAVYGQSVLEGVTYFQSTLSESDKKKVFFDWQDNEGRGVKSLDVAKKQLSQNPDVYVSGVKPQYLAIEDLIIKQKNLPNFAWIFDSYLRAKNSNNFRTWVNFKSEADLFLNTIKKKSNIKKVAIIYVITPTVVEQQNELIIPGLKAQGIYDHLVIPYQMDQVDFNSIALKVKKYNPDQIYLNGFQHNMVPLIRSFRRLSLIKENNTVASYDLLDAVGLMNPEELEGISFTMPSFLLSKDAKYISWKSRFKNRFKKEPLYTHFFAYEMASILYQVAEVNPNPDILDYLNKTKFKGILNELRFDGNGDVGMEVVYGQFNNAVLNISKIQDDSR